MSGIPEAPVYFVRPCFVTDFRATYADVAEAGITEVSIAAQMGDVSFIADDQADAARRFLDDLGLSTPACHGLHSSHLDLNTPDVGLWKDMIEQHRQFLPSAARMSCKTYVCHPGPRRKGVSAEASWDQVRRTLDELAPLAEELGVKIALENANPKNLGDDSGELTAFVAGYGSDAVGLCFDVGHANTAEDPVTALNAMAPLVITVHLHDNDTTGDQHLIPGRGCIDWADLVPRLAKCPRLIHIETEAFNTEGWTHRDLYQRYREILAG